MSSPFKDRMGQFLTWSQAGGKIANRFANYGLDFKLWFLWVVGYFPSHTLRHFFFRLGGLTLGNMSTLHIGARFYDPKNIKIGTGTIIGDHVTLDGRAPLTIGNHVDIASEVMVFNSQHDINDPAFAPIEAPVIIGDYVFIGPRAIILPGVNLGTGSVVAAGAVVTKDVLPYTLVGGVPARPIKERTLKDLHYRLGRPRLFQ